MIKQSIDTTLEICYSIYLKLIDLGYKEYPSGTCKELIEILIKVNQGIINNLEQKKEKIGKDVIEEKYRDEYEESVRREIIWYNKSLNFLHFLIQYVEESSTEHITLSTTYPIESIIKKFKPDAKFILRPDWEFNYSFIELTDPIKKTFSSAVPSIDKDLEKLPNGLAILNFPSAEKNNIFLHCAVSHEIGHFFDINSKISENFLSKDIKLDETQLNDIVNKISSKKIKKTLTIEDFVEKTRIRSDIMKECTQIIHSWSCELVADLFAIHIFGPAYLFAVSKIMVDRMDINSDTDIHPSTRYRINFLLNELKEIGYLEKLKKKNKKIFEEESIGDKIFNEIIKLETNLESIKKRDKEDIYQLCYYAIEQNIEVLKRQIRKEVAAVEFKPENFQENIPDLVSSLKHFIPPNEILDFDRKENKPSNLISILNAGWCFYLTEKKYLFEIFNANTFEEQMKAISKLNDLILKAIELSQSHEIWLQTMK